MRSRGTGDPGTVRDPLGGRRTLRPVSGSSGAVADRTRGLGTPLRPLTSGVAAREAGTHQCFLYEGTGVTVLLTRTGDALLFRRWDVGSGHRGTASGQDRRLRTATARGRGISGVTAPVGKGRWCVPESWGWQNLLLERCYGRVKQANMSPRMCGPQCRSFAVRGQQSRS